MARPGFFPLQSERFVTRHPACQIEKSRSTQVRQSQECHSLAGPALDSAPTQNEVSQIHLGKVFLDRIVVLFYSMKVRTRTKWLQHPGLIRESTTAVPDPRSIQRPKKYEVVPKSSLKCAVKPHLGTISPSESARYYQTAATLRGN